MRKKLLLFVGCVLIAGGALAFFYYGYLQLDMLRVQRAASRSLDQKTIRHSESMHAPSVPHAIVILPPRPDESIGRMEIPRLSVSIMVLEGTSATNLRVAAGHIPGTALPGVVGNVGIAAHRDTFFRPLRHVQPKDTIVLTTSYGTFRYVVDAIEIVGPTDVQVLHRTSNRELTLVTCYPFFYVGPAPKRFIVHARQQV
jgi:sortase A